jgi:hypothetical protein
MMYSQNPLDASVIQGRDASEVARFMTRVYGWMSLALVVTGLVALYTASSATLLELIFGNRIGMWVLIIGTFLLVGWMTMAIRTMSPTLATVLFMAYAALNGMLFSSILLVYTGQSIALTFFITAGTFAAMSVYGYTTKADLTKLGSLAIMALVGVIIASIVNIFMESETLYWIISYAGVAIFVALVAYDTQKIKDIAIYGFDGEASEKKASIIGALSLYLDFINLFLFLLRLFGSRRD